MLWQINELVDFSFVYNELKANYCLDNGRNAIAPLRMFKYLLLKAIFELSDAVLIERSRYNMSFKYFLQMAPEEAVIDPSSLTKFRKLRLKDLNLLDLFIGKTVELATGQGILKRVLPSLWTRRIRKPHPTYADLKIGRTNRITASDAHTARAPASKNAAVYVPDVSTI